MAKRPGMLDPLRVRVRRLQLIVGVGLIACVVGAVVSIPVWFRVLPWVSGSPAPLFEVVRALVQQLWAYAVLPALLYALARIIDLKPWTAGIGAVVTGTLFHLSITLISAGFDGITEQHPVRLVTILLTAAGGTWVCAFAVRSARAASQRAEEAARKKAEARKDEYAEFAREAERLANRTEAKEQGAAQTDASASTEGAGASAPTDASGASASTEGATPSAPTDAPNPSASTDVAASSASTRSATPSASTDAAASSASTRAATPTASTDAAASSASTRAATPSASTDSATSSASTDEHAPRSDSGPPQK